MSVPIATRLENLFTAANRSDSLAAENRRLVAAHDQYAADAVFLQEQHLARNRRLMDLVDDLTAANRSLRETIHQLRTQLADGIRRPHDPEPER